MPTVIPTPSGRYVFDMVWYLSRMFDGFGRRVLFPRPKYRSIGRYSGPNELSSRVRSSDRRPLNAEFFHSRLQRGSLESEVFGCAVLSTDFPAARLQDFFDVRFFNLFDRLAR